MMLKIDTSTSVNFEGKTTSIEIGGSEMVTEYFEHSYRLMAEVLFFDKKYATNEKSDDQNVIKKVHSLFVILIFLLNIAIGL